MHGEEQIVEALLEHGAEPDVMCRYESVQFLLHRQYTSVYSP